jgi:thiosulfate/3-mercaptopyruvate sulfurtransferase
MDERTLITVDRAAALLGANGVRFIDSRADILDKPRARRDYTAAHIPGAVFADMETDLADLSVPGRGRHPLPSAAAFSATLSRWGLAKDTDVIVYDDASGAMAARLWWMLRLAGHERVAVLDGGWAAWKAAGLPQTADVPSPPATDYAVRFDEHAIATSDGVAAMLARGDGALLDARAANRFRGENETIDPVAGHVPGARSRPFSDNLQPNLTFKQPYELRAELERILAGTPPSRTVLMCGSGVTACHDLLAMEHAGLRGARVYAGSWSEWIGDPRRPTATGPV